MALPLEFALEGSPVSQQTRCQARLRQWSADVRSTAERHWDGSPPVAGPVMISVAYIFDSTPIDVDNIPKPILDALTGLVYSDDSQVTDLICRVRNWHRSLRTTMPSRAFDEFLRNYNQFTYIRIVDAPTLGDPL